jgi:ketosteroid isomerase-like protein
MILRSRIQVSWTRTAPLLVMAVLGAMLAALPAELAGTATPAPAAPAPAVVMAPDSAAIAATVDRYHTALATGDSLAALQLLTEDALILESGGIETKEEYRSHHLPADIAFARAVPRERGPIHVTVRGDVAWAASSSTTRGEYQGRAINSAGAELMVLVRTADGWRISAIHWSSRTLRD